MGLLFFFCCFEKETFHPLCLYAPTWADEPPNLPNRIHPSDGRRRHVYLRTHISQEGARPSRCSSDSCRELLGRRGTIKRSRETPCGRVEGGVISDMIGVLTTTGRGHNNVENRGRASCWPYATRSVRAINQLACLCLRRL